MKAISPIHSVSVNRCLLRVQCLCLATLVAMLTAHSQPVTIWERREPLPDDQWIYASAACAAECGDSTFYMHVGRIGASQPGRGDNWLYRQSESGELVWQQNTGDYDDEARDLLLLPDQSIIFCGRIRSQTGVDRGLLVHRLASGDNNYWSRTFTGRGGATRFFDVEATSDGGYIVSGQTSGGDSGWDLFLLKTTGGGDSVWSRFYGGSSDQKDGAFVAELPDGGYAIAGTKQNGSHGGSDYYLVRTNSVGDTLWTRDYGTGNADELRDGKATSDGGFILAGRTFSVFQWNYYLVKTDVNGNVMWTRNFGELLSSDVVNAIIEEPTGGFTFVGTTHDLSTANGSLCQLAPDGSTRWFTTYVGADSDSLNSLASDGPYYVLGGRSSTGSQTFDAWTVKCRKDTVVAAGIWTLANSPYEIYGNVVVRAGETLIIEQGVQVIFRRNAQFTINGTLLCHGTYEDSVRFTFESDAPSLPDSGWGGLRFVNAVNCSLAFTDVGFAISNSGDGAGLSGVNSDLSVYRTKVRGCRLWAAGAAGAGVYLNSSNVVFVECAIVDNYCLEGNGGGIACANGSEVYMYKTDISRNYASRGGGLHAAQSIVTMDSVHFGENQAITLPLSLADRLGGAIAAESGAQLVMNHCVAAANIVSWVGHLGFLARAGCFMYVHGPTTTAQLTRCTLIKNSNSDISSIAVEAGNVALNSTIISSQLGSSATVHTSPGVLTFSYCDIFQTLPIASDGGNVLPADIGSGQFVNANGDPCDSYVNVTGDPEFWGAHLSDDRVRNCSPCIDAGDSALPHDPDGTTADIGSSYFGHTGQVSYEPSESCSTATAIQFPFCYRAGTTVGHVNDFSTCALNSAPDVGFTYAPVANHFALLDLCVADYDALLEVRAGGACPGDVQVACNDDHPACGLGARLTMEFEAGETYYIIVDGSGSFSGQYDFTMTESPICELGPFSGTYENEPCPYVIDTVNGGCFSPGFLAQEFPASLSGTSFSAGAGFDTDWYHFQVDEQPGDSSRVLLTAEANFPGALSVVRNVLCPLFDTIITVAIDTCDTTEIDLLLSGGEYYFVVTASVTHAFPCSEYHVQKRIIRGGTLSPCPIEPEPGDVEESIDPEPYPPSGSYAELDPNGGCASGTQRVTLLPTDTDTVTIHGRLFTYVDSASQLPRTDQDFFSFALNDVSDVTWFASGEHIGTVRGVIAGMICPYIDSLETDPFECNEHGAAEGFQRIRLPAGAYFANVSHRLDMEADTLESYRARLTVKAYHEQICPHDFVVDLTTPFYSIESSTCGATDKSDLREGRDHVFKIINPERREFEFSLCESAPLWSTYLFLTSGCSTDTIAWNDNDCGAMSRIACGMLDFGVHYLTLEPGTAEKCNPYSLTIAPCLGGIPCSPFRPSDVTILLVDAQQDGAQNDVKVTWSNPGVNARSYSVYSSAALEAQFPGEWTLESSGASYSPGAAHWMDLDVTSISSKKFYVVVGVCP